MTGRHSNQLNYQTLKKLFLKRTANIINFYAQTNKKKVYSIPLFMPKPNRKHQMNNRNRKLEMYLIRITFSGTLLSFGRGFVLASRRPDVQTSGTSGRLAVRTSCRRPQVSSAGLDSRCPDAWTTEPRYPDHRMSEHLDIWTSRHSNVRTSRSRANEIG